LALNFKSKPSDLFILRITHFQQREAPFVLAGLVFLAMGLAMLLACALLQRKNITKFVLDLDQDLYFLRMSDYAMWKMIFDARDGTAPTEGSPLDRIDASYLK